MANYIPPRDADLATWSTNFSSLITASPATYGLATGDATAIASSNAAWQSAYATAISPATRTPTTVQAKDVARTTWLQTARPYSQQIANNAGVSASAKIALGLNPRTATPTPIAAPTTYPVLSISSALSQIHIMYARDNLASPSVKAKPFGAIGLQLFAIAGTASPVIPVTINTPTKGLFTKIPFTVDWLDTQIGETAYYAARWYTRTGLAGPLSPTVSFVIPG